MIGVTRKISVARQVSAKTGAFFDEDRDPLHASGFIIRRNTTLALAAYSTGAIGYHTRKR
jgi:hypothetical protein